MFPLAHKGLIRLFVGDKHTSRIPNNRKRISNLCDYWCCKPWDSFICFDILFYISPKKEQITMNYEINTTFFAWNSRVLFIKRAYS